MYTKYARRRILKYVKLHRDRSVGELYERSIYERYSIYKMIMSEFFIGKYAIAISTELSYVIRKKDVCEFHHVFRRDRESNQARTDRMSRKVRLFVCYARMHVPCILKSSTNTMYRYGAAIVLFKEHFFSNNYPLISFTFRYSCVHYFCMSAVACN